MDSSDNDVHSIVGTVLLESGFRLLKDVVCVKPNPPAPHFHPFHRTVLLGGQSRKGANAGHVFHCQDMRCEAGGKQMKSVWRFSTRGAPRSHSGNIQPKSRRYLSTGIFGQAPMSKTGC